VGISFGVVVLDVVIATAVGAVVGVADVFGAAGAVVAAFVVVGAVVVVDSPLEQDTRNSPATITTRNISLPRLCFVFMFITPLFLLMRRLIHSILLISLYIRKIT
jgi:hypothetical protein